MKKIFLVLIPVLALAAGCASRNKAEAGEPHPKPSLGVLPFTGGSGLDGDTIASLFANSRDLRQEFAIVPRTSSVDLIVKEQQFQRSGLTDSDTIAELGKQMNADYVVSGHISAFGGTNLLVISIVDVKTMRQVSGDYNGYARVEDIRNLLPPMARNIIASIQGRGASSETGLAVLPLNMRFFPECGPSRPLWRNRISKNRV